MPISPGLLLLELCTFGSLLPILSTLPLATPSLFSMSSHSFLNVYVAPRVAIIVDMGNNFSLHSISFETFPSLRLWEHPRFPFLGLLSLEIHLCDAETVSNWAVSSQGSANSLY